MASDKRSLEEKVAGWLATEGYRLEYQTLKALRDAGLKAYLGKHVRSAQGKPREIDVMVLETHRKNDRHDLFIRLLCECKYSAGKPWVLLDADQRCTAEELWKAIPKSQGLASSNVFQHKGKLNGSIHFSVSETVAHTVLQAWVKADPGEAGEDEPQEKERRNNRDFAFDSLQKIANAAWDSAEDNASHSVLAVIVPCIVIDGSLLLARFSHEKNAFEVTKTSFGRLLWSGARAEVLVDVVNISEIAQYAKHVATTFEKLMSMMMQDF